LFSEPAVAVPPIGGRKHDSTNATTNDQIKYSGAVIGGEICTCGIVGRSIHAEAICEIMQKIQGSLANIKDKSLLQRMTKNLEDDRDALTCYVKMLEAENAQLENGSIPVPFIMRTSLANSKAAIASDVSECGFTKAKTRIPTRRPGVCGLLFQPYTPLMACSTMLRRLLLCSLIAI
jgi:hypothetical protein